MGLKANNKIFPILLLLLIIILSFLMVKNEHFYLRKLDEQKERFQNNYSNSKSKSSIQKLKEKYNQVIHSNINSYKNRNEHYENEKNAELLEEHYTNITM